MNKQTITINGANFSDLETFYDEIDRVLTKGLNWKTGHNLNAFNDLLYGGFGVHEYEEPIKLIWIKVNKSKEDLGLEATKNYYKQEIQNPNSLNVQLYKEELDKLGNGTGQTFFDIIIEIISKHDDIEFLMQD